MMQAEWILFIYTLTQAGTGTQAASPINYCYVILDQIAIVLNQREHLNLYKKTLIFEI
jgi:hypothetical protein